MSLNFDLPSILGNELAGAQLAGNHRLRAGAAPPAVGTFIFGFRVRASAGDMLSLGNGAAAAGSSTSRPSPRHGRRGLGVQRAWG